MKATTAFASVLFVACSAGGHARGPTAADAHCPSSPLEGVPVHPNHPEHLRVLKACQTYQGVVAFVKRHDDGDFHVDIRPDQGFQRFLSPKVEVPDTLVTEIIPAHSLPIPRVGDHVRITGTWVYDTIHGWNEIHPVWTITKI